MDLNLLDAAPTEAEREAIDTVVGEEPGSSNRVARADRTRRHLLLPALRAAQLRVGWVSEGALGYASRRLSVPPADAYGVASFYALLALEERPADLTHVCTDLSCALKGARVGPDEHPSPCLGLCERAPASYRTIAGVEPRELQLPEAAPPLPQAGDPSLRLLRRIGDGIDPTSLDGVQHRRRLCTASPGPGTGRRSGDRRAEGFAPARPWRCGVPHRRQMGGGGRAARPAALRRLQRRRVRARHLQGPRPDGERPVRAGGGDCDRSVRDGRIEGVHLRPGRVSARARRGSETRSRRAGPTSTGSRSSCGSAPAPTSAARRLRSSSRSRAIAASRATSRRSRSRSACSGNRRP